MARLTMGLSCLLVSPFTLAAQDTTQAAGGVRVGITYTPGVRPGVLVLGGPRDVRLDSVRAILARDLEYSDRFELISLPSGDSLGLGLGGANRPDYVNYPLYAALGADWAVAAEAANESLVRVRVFDVGGQAVRREVTIGVSDIGDANFRLLVHRTADEIVRAVSGTPGVAATRLLLLQRGRLYTVDSDGAGLMPISPANTRALSSAWGPRGQRLVYMEFGADDGARLWIMDPVTGERRAVPPTSEGLNFAMAFSPDGTQLAFSRANDEGTDILVWNVERTCCLQRLTVGRFSDNLSPTYSPDGRRIAFVSTRAGAPQIYVMEADGTGQELFAPFDYGVTGTSNAPDWSPDGQHIAFHRDVAGAPQIFVMDVRTRTVRQLTSLGRNEDPTWAPDGRHLAFVSDRTGNRQIWIIDLDTGRVRQLTRLGEARLPAWSPRID
ncbi:MAG: DPP IV N-terminal domain-containing protein [Gemmatimonadales bacterium]